MKRMAGLLLVLAGGVAFEDAATAYRSGDFDLAYERFAAMASERGEDVPAELWYDLALSAVSAGRPEAAEIAAERMAVAGGSPWYARRDFFLGSAAWARSARSELLADRPEGGVPELDAAIVHTRAASAHWRAAAVRGEDWPAARRNVERALRRMAALEEKRREMAAQGARDERSESSGEEEGAAGSEPDGEAAPDESAAEARTAPGAEPPEAVARELAPERVSELADKLEAKRDEKRRLRRARLRRSARGGADW